MTAPFPPSLVSPVLVGRETQLSALDRLIEQASRSIGSTALIMGEAGIGKSRLVAETIRHARNRWREDGSEEPLVLQARCFEPDHALPYAPLRDLLRTYLAAEPRQGSTHTADPLSAQLTMLLPELHTITPIPAPDPQQERQRIIQAFVQFVAQHATRPLLVVIEDLHWSDDTSLEVLLTLARHIVTQPILLLLTYRDDVAPPSLTHVFATLERERLAGELRLARLDYAEMDAMVQAIFNQRQPIRGDFLSALFTLIETERLLAGIAFDQDALHSRGIIKRPNRPQTGGSSVDAIQAIAEGLVGGWVWIPIGCLNPYPPRAIPSLRKNELAGSTDSPDV